MNAEIFIQTLSIIFWSLLLIGIILIFSISIFGIGICLGEMLRDLLSNNKANKKLEAVKK